MANFSWTGGQECLVVYDLSSLRSLNNLLGSMRADDASDRMLEAVSYHSRRQLVEPSMCHVVKWRRGKVGSIVISQLSWP